MPPHQEDTTPTAGSDETLLVMRLTPDARLPTYGSAEAAGLDLSLAHPDGRLVIAPGERALAPTGLAIRVPRGTYGRVAPRSGLAVKHGIDVLAGVVDRDYAGPVHVALINLGQAPVTLENGDRIAQLVLEKIVRATAIEVSADTGLPRTDRGAGGFGSTGR